MPPMLLPSPAVLRIPAFTWTPADIGASLVGFLDFEDNTKITNVSGAVSQIVDSVSGAAFAQGTAASRPALITSPTTGRQVASFDGIDDELTYAGIPTGWATGGTANTIMLLGSASAMGTGASSAISYGGTSVNNARYLGVNSSLQCFGSVGQGSDRITLNVSAGGAWSVPRIGFLEIGAASSYVSIDGVAGASLACAPSTATTRSRLGGNTANTPGLLWWGEISAALVISGALSAEALNNVHIWARIRNGG